MKGRHIVALAATLLAACGGSATVDAGLGVDAGPIDSGSVDLGPIDLGGFDAAGCTSAPDVDGDGHRSIACGGDDCDDNDVNRFPGHAEVCDATNHDEDCDPMTFGFRDGDSDSYADMHCCNVSDTGVMTCGRDCDDANPSVHPTATEVCNTVDDNCDGMVDEGVILTCYSDGDHDGYAPLGATVSTACICAVGATGVQPTDATNTDCDDAHMTVHPGLAEVPLNSIDDNCNGAIDENYQARGAITPLGGVVLSGATYKVVNASLTFDAERTCGPSGSLYCVRGGIEP